MRKLLSVVLFGLLLYNMTGYSVVYLLEEMNSIGVAADLVEKQPYSRDILIKVPLDIPCQITWGAPESTGETIESDGEFYHMVSRQLIDDTLYVQCEYDQEACDRFTDLVSNINEQVMGDGTEPAKDKPSSVLKSFMKEYMVAGRDQTYYLLEWRPDRIYCASYSKSYRELHQLVPSPPPDRAYFS